MFYNCLLSVISRQQRKGAKYEQLDEKNISHNSSGQNLGASRGPNVQAP